jgi:hypothetical protein
MTRTRTGIRATATAAIAATTLAGLALLMPVAHQLTSAGHTTTATAVTVADSTPQDTTPTGSDNEDWG